MSAQQTENPGSDANPAARSKRRDIPTRPIQESIRPTDRRIAMAIGLLLLAVYLATSGFHLQSIDEVSTFTPARSLLGRGTTDADAVFWQQPEGNKGGSVVTGIDGHAYEVKDIGLTLLILPLVWLADLIKIISPVRTAMLASPIITALTAGLIYRFARQRGYARTVSLLTALGFGLASLAWPYAETLFTQPLAGLGLLLAFGGALLAYERRSWRFALLSGIGIGIASISAIPTVVSLPIYPLYLIPWASLRNGSWRTKWRETAWQLAAFIVGLAPFGALHGVLDQAQFGSPFITPYHASQVQDALQLSNLGVAGFGLLLSTPRGLLWYAPAVILIPFGIWLGWKARRRELILVAAQAVITIGFYCTYTEWWGGNAWGPRLFLPVMPALAWLAAPLGERLSGRPAWWPKALAALPLAVSAATQGLATLFNVLLSERRFYDALIKVRQSATFVRDNSVLTDPANLPWARLATVIQRGQWDTLWMSRGKPDWTLIGAWAALAALGGLWLALSLKKKQPGWLRAALNGQIVLTVVVAAFALTRYPHLPSNYTPSQTPPLADLTQAINQVNDAGTREDQIITLLPYTYLAWLDRTSGAIHDTGFVYEQPIRGLTEKRLEQISTTTGRIWLVSERMGAGNGSNGVEQWLSQHAFVGADQSFGNYRVTTYTFGGPIAQQMQNKAFGTDGIELSSSGYELVRQPRSEWLDVWLRWDTRKAIPNSYTVFIHLLNEDGALSAQHDGLPAAAFAPTQSWKPGAVIDDRHSIPIDLTLPAGMYQIRIGLYDTQTGQRLPLADDSGDTLLIGTVDIR